MFPTQLQLLVPSGENIRGFVSLWHLAKWERHTHQKFIIFPQPFNTIQFRQQRQHCKYFTFKNYNFPFYPTWILQNRGVVMLLTLGGPSFQNHFRPFLSQILGGPKPYFYYSLSPTAHSKDTPLILPKKSK